MFVTPAMPAPITLYAWNNTILAIGDVVGYGIEVKSGNRAFISNNTFVANPNAIRVETGTSVVVRNNVAMSCVLCLNSDTALTGSGNLTADPSASKLGVGAMLPSTNPLAYFVSSADLHIDPTRPFASALIDNGSNLASDPELSFTTDIDGVVRSGTWDVGSDELSP